MGGARRGILPAFQKTLEPELPDRLEHAEPGLAVLSGALDEDALVDEVGDGLQGRGVSGFARDAGALEHGACRRYRASAAKDGEEAPGPPAALVEEVVAPGNRLPHGSMALGQVPRAPREEIEPGLELLEDLRGRQHLDPGGG